jgi:hypothetical protein
MKLSRVDKEVNPMKFMNDNQTVIGDSGHVNHREEAGAAT